MKKRPEPDSDLILYLTEDGRTLYAPEGGKPTSESPFHLRILQMRPDLNAVLHAHPPVLTGFAINGGDWLKRPYLPEPVLEVGPMVLVPYAEPGSDELAQAFDGAINRSNGFLMQNHGVLMTSVESVKRALELLEMVESQAKSLVVAIALAVSLKPFVKSNASAVAMTIPIRSVMCSMGPGNRSIGQRRADRTDL